MQSAVKRLFYPQSVAVVGASNTPQKPGYNIIDTLQHFSGYVYPINPKADEVCGFKAYATMADVGKPIDLAIFTIPADKVLEGIKDAISAKVTGCMIVTSGFGEIEDDKGRILQDTVANLCKKSGIRILGPNTAGFMNPEIGLYATFVPGVEVIQPGNVAVVSQSGAVSMILAFLTHRRGMGLRLSVSLGNSIDIDYADMIEFLAEDDKTDVILLYAEGIPGGRALYEAIKKTVPKKPIVALLVGKADIADLAKSHTGNFIGSYMLKRSVLEQAGAIVVNSTNETVDAANTFSRQRLPANADPGVGIITGQAGPGILMTDLLRDADVSVPELSKASLEKISAMLPPLTYIKNPVDTGRPSKYFPEIIRTVANDENIDAVVTFAIDEADALKPIKLFENEVHDIDKPQLFGTVGICDQVYTDQMKLGDINIPSFIGPESVAQAVKYLALDAKAQLALIESEKSQSAIPPFDLELNGDGFNEAQSKAIIQKIGIDIPENRVCTNHDEACQALQELGGPVVVKILDSNIPHKTDVGGVHVNIKDKEQMSVALKSIDVISPTGESCYLVEKMAEPGLEFILGGQNDRNFGPVILAGMGGVATEAFKDSVMRAAPVTPYDADLMLKKLRSYDMLDGWRGASSIDKDALINAIVNLSHLLYQYPQIKEIDINPVRLYPHGIIALDALISI